MKKRLLITLGCSFTEGMGCYDYSVFPKGKHLYSPNIPQNIIDYQRNKFHELGWPNKLGKKLGFDEVLNLGLSGASASGNLKSFFQSYWQNEFLGYEVYILWWIPQPHRISFYTNGKIEDIIPNNTNDPDFNKLGNAYLNFVVDVLHDSTLEVSFYLKTMISYCSKMNFNFLWFIDDSQVTGEYFRLLPKQNYLGKSVIDFFTPIYTEENEMVNQYDLHPNEKGYEFIANELFNVMKKKHANWVNPNKPDKFEWDWKGNPPRINPIHSSNI